MIVSLDEVKIALGITEDDQDEKLEGDLVRAEAFLVLETGRYWGEPITRVDFVDGMGTRELWLDERPSAADPVPIVEVECPAGVWTVVPATEYEIRDFRLIQNERNWICGRENYRVTTERGYAEGATDDDYQTARSAVLKMVQALQVSSETLGLRSESLGPYSYTAAGDDSTRMRNAAAEELALIGWVRV